VLITIIDNNINLRRHEASWRLLHAIAFVTHTRTGNAWEYLFLDHTGKTRTCIDKKLVGQSRMIDVMYGARKYRRQNFEVAEHVLIQQIKRHIRNFF